MENNASMTGFKDTRFGTLPVDWEVVQLHDVFNEVDIRARDFNKKKPDEFEVLSLTKNFGLIPQSQRFNNRIATEDVSNYKVVQLGQLVYNPYVIWEGAIHTLRKYEDGVVSPAYPVLEAKPEIADAYYLDDLLRTPLAIAAYNKFSSGAVNRRRAISKRDFGQIQIPLPPLPEQRAIAHILTTVRQSIEATERVIAAARELKRSMMKYLFTYGPVPIDQADQVVVKQTEIGEMPDEWQVKPLGAIEGDGGSIQTGPFGSLLHAADYVPTGIPFVMPKDLSDDANILTETVAYIGVDDYQRLEKYQLQSGDVITARRGEIGRRALVTDKENGWVCGTGCLRIRPGLSINPRYLAHALGTKSVRSWLLDHSVGSTMPNLSGLILKQLPFPFPRFTDQSVIADYLSHLDLKISNEIHRKIALEALFNSLLQHLMTGKVRVADV